MHAAGRVVDRWWIEEEPGDGAAIDMHLLEFLAVDLCVDAHRLESGGIAAEADRFIQNDEGVQRRP